MNRDAVGFQDLVWISGCLALALAAHVARVPIWIFAVVSVCGGIRLVSAYRGRSAPPRALRLSVAALAAMLLFLQFHTFNGLAAGTALLVLMAGLKLMESDSKRDIYILTLIIYFVGLSALLEGDSFWLLSYLIGVALLTTATLLRLTTTQPAPKWRRSLRYAARILLQALPLALIFWLFFPRFAEPLWHMPSDSRSAASGLSDTMSPGDITELALSDEIAFRVHFAGAVPPPAERYWRGPVLSDFNGRMWQRSYSGLKAPALQMQGPAYRYTISLEPHQHNWIFALDWPSAWNLARGALAGDYTLVQPEPVSRPVDVVATSYTHVQSAEPLSATLRTRDTHLPANRNPRTLQLSQTLRSQHPGDQDYVNAVLALFSQEAFYYTLTPPPLSDDSIDAFLFDTRRGFCGHYASAFAVLMRAAGIPARVVTGYQGGAFNRFADYWIIRQSDAHAWDEIWIEGEGWTRVDPTASIAPTRVEHDVNEAATADEPLTVRWRHAQWLTDTRLRLDALRQLWRERVLFFDQNSQQQLLELMRIPEPDGQKLVLVMAAGLALALTWLTWAARREIRPAPADPLVKAYARLCAKLAAVGLPRMPYEGPEAYAARIAALRPELGDSVAALCHRYSQLRYGAALEGGTSEGAPRVDALREGAALTRGAANAFRAAVRAFRPSRRPAA